MFPFRPRRNNRKDFAIVESMKDELITEEFPEGPCGSCDAHGLAGKSTP